MLSRSRPETVRAQSILERDWPYPADRTTRLVMPLSTPTGTRTLSMRMKTSDPNP